MVQKVFNEPFPNSHSCSFFQLNIPCDDYQQQSNEGTCATYFILKLLTGIIIVAFLF